MAAAILVLAAGCAEAPTDPQGQADEPNAPVALAYAVQRLECRVDLAKGGDLECEPASAGQGGGPNYDLIVGSQHRFVRLENEPPEVEDGVWSAKVTVQNLTLQPMATEDGETPDAEGVRVFFVDEPNNGVEVANADGEYTFTGSEPQKYYEYSGGLLGADGILTQGDKSEANTWQFALNGETEFQFAVLVWTKVPDPEAYSVHLTRISAGGAHTCGDGSDGKVYCWGRNDNGQLGNDSDDQSSSTPVAVKAPGGVTLSGVTASNAGSFSCANGSDGNLYCWGSNGSGQLGDGTTTSPRRSPVVVQAPAGMFRSFSTGGNHACALSAAGPAYCWGNNGNGRLGNGRTTNSSVPVVVAGTK